MTYADLTTAEKRSHMRDLITRYFDACNDADADTIAACFIPDGTHYFPPGMYGGAWRGARLIAERWAESVAARGSAWTIDRMVCEPETDQAVIEWTHYKTREGTVLRGDEWYLFDPATGLIAEIRAYYAAPQDRSLARLELDGFDYAARGYHLESPVPR
jgi:ketosteroid isomerase-like protein